MLQNRVSYLPVDPKGAIKVYLIVTDTTEAGLWVAIAGILVHYLLYYFIYILNLGYFVYFQNVLTRLSLFLLFADKMAGNLGFTGLKALAIKGVARAQAP